MLGMVATLEILQCPMFSSAGCTTIRWYGGTSVDLIHKRLIYEWWIHSAFQLMLPSITTHPVLKANHGRLAPKFGVAILA